MSYHQEIPEEIRTQTKEFQTKLSNLEGLRGADREEAVVKHEKHLKRIRRLMETYKYAIESGAFEEKIGTHKSQYKEFEVEIGRLQKQLENNRQDVATEEQLFRHKPKSSKKVQENPNSREVLVQRGDEAQKESEAILKRGARKVYEMHEKADVIMTEMDRQINQLDTIYEQLNDTETTLKRAEKHLKYFARQVYTDRCLIFLIVIIAISIIVIIALAIAGKTPQQQNNQVA